MSKENAVNANTKTDDVKEDQKPTNPRTLVKEDESVDDTIFSAEVMQDIIDTNKRLMSADVKTKFDAYLTFVKANPDMIIRTHDDYHVQVMMLPGSYRNPEKPSEFLNSDYLPGTIMVKNLHDAKGKLRVPFTTGLAIVHYMNALIEAYPEVVAYNVALEREINTRNSDSNVFDLGK